jgi:hypothetical protein
MWKKIKNVIGPAHEVSDSGEVRQCVAWRDGDVVRNVPRVPSIDRNGYLYIQFYDGVRQQNRKVHRIVADAFIPNPKKLPYVNFRNGDKQNCNIKNLVRTKARHYKPKSTGKKLNETEVRMIRALSRCGAPRQGIADLTGVSLSMISHIVHGRKWAWVK